MSNKILFKRIGGCGEEKYWVTDTNGETLTSNECRNDLGRFVFFRFPGWKYSFVAETLGSFFGSILKRSFLTQLFSYFEKSTILFRLDGNNSLKLSLRYSDDFCTATLNTADKKNADILIRGVLCYLYWKENHSEDW